MTLDSTLVRLTFFIDVVFTKGLDGQLISIRQNQVQKQNCLFIPNRAPIYPVLGIMHTQPAQLP
jgi:hypothetical protein